MSTPPKRLGPKWYQDLSHLLQFSRACLAKLQARSFFNHKTTLVYNSRGSAIRTTLACISKTNMRQKKLTSMVKTTNLRYWRVQGIAPIQSRPTNWMRVFNAYQRAINQVLRILETLYLPYHWCKDLKRTLISKMTFKTIFILHSNKIWWMRKAAHLKSENNRTKRSSQLAKSSKSKGKSNI